jgi:hypothetical protein
MLNKYESIVSNQYKLLSAKDQSCYCIKFNKAEDDVRCCAYVYNIAVTTGNY